MNLHSTLHEIEHDWPLMQAASREFFRLRIMRRAAYVCGAVAIMELCWIFKLFRYGG